MNLLRRIIGALRRAEPVNNHPFEGTGTDVRDTPAGKRWLLIASNRCPHCKKVASFYEGPSGGMSINIQCEHCGWWFNVTPAIGIAEDIGEKNDSEKRNPPWRPEL